MVSDTGRKTVSRIAWARIALALLAALIALLALLLFWLLATESGARGAFALLAKLPNAPVLAEGVHGRLVSPLRIEKLVLDTKGQRITLANLQLEWQPRDLLSREVHINSLRIARIELAAKEKQEEEPARLPDSIALPVKLRADKVLVDGGAVHLAPGSAIALGPLALNLDYDGARYRLQLERMSASTKSEAAAVSGNFLGDATISIAKPYPLRVELSSRGEAVVEEQKFGASGQIRIDGSMETLAVAADLGINEARINGNAVLRPFSASQKLGAANLLAQAVDLAAFRPGLPRTRLAASLSAGANGAGELRLSNPEAGLLNDGRLPLSELRLAFRQEGGEVLFDAISAALGAEKAKAGAVTGHGKLAGGALSLTLETEALDLRKLDQRARSTRLAGQVDLQSAAGRQALTVDLSEPFNRRQITLHAQAVLADEAISVEQARLAIGEGRLEVSGRAALAGAQDFRASGTLRRFRPKDLGEFAQLPDVLLNGEFKVGGARQPALTADLDFRIADSRIGDQPLQGEGKAQLRADSLLVDRLSLAAGANRLDVDGRLSQSGGELRFAIAAPKLDQIGANFGGLLDAKGTVRGSFDKPRIEASWNAGNLRFAELLRIESAQGKADAEIDRAQPFSLHAAALDATLRGLRSGERQAGAVSAVLRFAPTPDAPLRIAIQANDVKAGAFLASRIAVDGNGTTAQHALDFTVVESGQRWRMQANGGLKSLSGAPEWEGVIQSFDADGRFAARLAAPAPLALSQQRVRLDRFRLDANAAVIAIDQFLRDQDGIQTRGNIERLQIAQILKFSAKEPALSTDLQLSGDWNVKLTDKLAGTVHMRRDSGDIVMRGAAPVPLGLHRLEASAQAGNGELTVQLRLEGQQAGRVEADVRAAMTGAGPVGIDDATALGGKVSIDVPSLSWVTALVSPTLVANGRLQSAIAIGGTVGSPRLDGKLNGSGLRVLATDLGVDLRQGALEANFVDSRLVLQSLRFGNPGAQLVATGEVEFEGKPSARIVVRADHFPVLDRSDRKLRISGESRIAYLDAQARVDGDFVVDSGFVDITSIDMPRLSDDVIVVGRDDRKADKPGEKPTAAIVDIRIRVSEEGVALRGRGLDAKLGGEVRLASQAGEPLQARGTLRIAQGTFKAYGRELKIEQGAVRFNGPLNNPALDILAMRRGQEVEAGVAVRGSVLAPRITLVSEPQVSDAEKLSWLVLGRGLATAGEGDVGALTSAAGALLSQGAAAGVQSQIASTFGLDQFSIGNDKSGGLQQRIVTLGKQISSKLYVSFERGLENALTVLHLRYTLSPKISLEAQAGTRSALSVFYNLSFD